MCFIYKLPPPGKSGIVWKEGFSLKQHIMQIEIIPNFKFDRPHLCDTKKTRIESTNP